MCFIRDSLEEIGIRDVVDLVWETFRLRRMKATMMTDAAHREIGDTQLRRSIAQAERAELAVDAPRLAIEEAPA
jgi:hypothetical protein